MSFSIILVFATLIGTLPSAYAQQPGFWKWAQTPPMGWNSYDAYKDRVNEAETLENAQFMKDHLLIHGWKYVIIDFRWYDPAPEGNDFTIYSRLGAKLSADAYGRMLPAENRFPSSASGRGFKPLADKIHSMGLKFGFHMMRGIPRQSVLAKTPIEGGSFTAADAGDQNDKCGWCPDMFGVQNNEAGQAWYDAMFRLYASWGIDFIKVDDLSNPYHIHEIEMIRKAIDRCGRAIVLSTSAGPTDLGQANHIMQHANMWRISGDFWDHWQKLDQQFDLFDQWTKTTAAGAGHYPDGDMIPFGEIRSQVGGSLHKSAFTPDEEKTLMSLWALESSPLMLGAKLPTLDNQTLSWLTNDEVLKIDQDKLSLPAKKAWQSNGLEIWVKPLKNSSKAIGLFNRTNSSSSITLNFSDAGLTGAQSLRDLWKREDLGKFDSTFTVEVPAHGAVLLCASSAKK